MLLLHLLFYIWKSFVRRFYRAKSVLMSHKSRIATNSCTFGDAIRRDRTHRDMHYNWMCRRLSEWPYVIFFLAKISVRDVGFDRDTRNSSFNEITLLVNRLDDGSIEGDRGQLFQSRVGFTVILDIPIPACAIASVCSELVFRRWDEPSHFFFPSRCDALITKRDRSAIVE